MLSYTKHRVQDIFKMFYSHKHYLNPLSNKESFPVTLTIKTRKKHPLTE